MPFSQAMFTLVNTVGTQTNKNADLLSNIFVLQRASFFLLLENTEVFNPQSFLLLNPKFHSVKPSVSTCQSASFCQIPSFCQVKSFLLSIRKVVPVKPEFSSYQTRSFLLSNSKLPHFESRLSVKSKVSFFQFGNFFLTNLNFSPFSEVSFCQTF